VNGLIISSRRVLSSQEFIFLFLESLFFLTADELGSHICVLGTDGQGQDENHLLVEGEKLAHDQALLVLDQLTKAEDLPKIG